MAGDLVMVWSKLLHENTFQGLSFCFLAGEALRSQHVIPGSYKVRDPSHILKALEAIRVS